MLRGGHFLDTERSYCESYTESFHKCEFVNGENILQMLEIILHVVLEFQFRIENCRILKWKGT